MKKIDKILLVIGGSVLIVITIIALVFQYLPKDIGVAPQYRGVPITAICGYGNATGTCVAIPDGSTTGTASYSYSILSDGTFIAQITQDTASTTNVDDLRGLNTLSSMYARVNDTNVKPVGLDGSTQALLSIDYDHHEIHSGESFVYATTTNIASGASFIVLVDTADTPKLAHMFFTSDVEQETLFEIYEDPVITASGTLKTNGNRNRTVGGNANTKIYEQPTVTSLGIEILRSKVGSGNKEGGDVRGEGEFVLKKATSYLFRITNDSATTGWVSPLFNFYEHANKN